MSVPSGPSLDLRLLPERYAIVRQDAGDALPEWFPRQGFRHVSWTAEELSLVCAEHAVPSQARSERGWRALMLQGPFAFELTGILLAVLAPLAQAGVGIFALSTFDTDYVLVKEAALETALDALRASGHRVAE